MISVNKSTAAFVRFYRDSGGRAQRCNISVIDLAELVKLTVVREYQALLKKYAPKELVNYTSFEEFLGAKVLVEALRRAGPNPTRAKATKSLESMDKFDMGGVTVNYSPVNRIESRYVEVTVIGSTGKLLKQTPQYQ